MAWARTPGAIRRTLLLEMSNTRSLKVGDRAPTFTLPSSTGTPVDLAEYLTALATAGFLPFEIYELVGKVTVLRLAAMAINLVVLVYLRNRRVLLGIGVATVASVVAALPFLIHLTAHPLEVSGRYDQTAVLDPRNQERLAYLQPPEPLAALAALQVERTLGMFDRYPDGGGFLPTGRPLFGPPLAQLALVGAVYLLVRGLRDVRLAVVSVWFWLGLSGVALTVETPDYLRSVGMLPSLCFVLAVPLLDLLDQGLAAIPVVRRDVLAGAAPAVVGALLLTPEVVGYFVTFRTLPAAWGPETREGKVVAALGAAGPVYSLEMNEHLVNSGWVRVLAPTAERGRIPNPGRELPVVTPVQPGAVRPEFFPAAGQGFSVVLAPDPNQRPYIPFVESLYPDATTGDAGDGRQSIQVSAASLDASDGVMLIDDAGSHHPVERFGDIPAAAAPSGQLTWRAGVRLPVNGVYSVSVIAPWIVQLRVDGVQVLDGAGPSSADIQAADGFHFVELQAAVSTASDHVGLLIAGSELTPRQTYRWMDAPWGLLARLARPLGDAPAAHLDAAVAMAFVDPELGFVMVPNSIVWSGSLVAPRGGVYRMAFASEDSMHLLVDGQPADVVTVSPQAWQSVGLGSEVPLSEGSHRVQVTLDISHGGREIARWNWVPPLASGAIDAASGWAVVPPEVLRPDAPANLVR